METSSPAAQPGGFFHPSLPSPPESSQRSGSIEPSHLPRTRAHPLKSGSAKEGSVIYYLDDKLLAISRRYERRIEESTRDGEQSRTEGGIHGYTSFGELSREMGAVIDVVWVTASPALQTSYLLTIALSVCTYLPSFPFCPSPSFHLLDKLDLAFASLLEGSNVETGERLPGFEGLLGARGIDTTKKVRMKGIVERTRKAVVEVAAQGGGSIEDMSSLSGRGVTSDEDTTMGDDNDFDNDVAANEGRENWEMKVATVYERTIVLLGESLDSAINGIGL